MKLISTKRAKGLFLAICVLGLSAPMDAATYTWRGTNSSAWTTAGNWLASQVGPTGGLFPHRLDVNSAGFNPLVYDESLGTTIYGTNGIRGFTIGSGANGSGTLTISGGTFMTTNGSAGDVVGNSDNNTGTLNISGGTFVSGSPTIVLGLGGGVNRASILNVNSGSATMGTVAINTTRGTINFNGGMASFSNMTAALSGTTATNNFNGGTVRARANSPSFIPVLSQANVRDGGAIIDSAGFNISIVQPLAHSVISGDAERDGGLTKNGAGTLTLKGVPSYTGPTVINSGTLAAPLPEVGSALVVAAGARYSPALTNYVWRLASVALTNATIDFNYGAWPLNSYSSAALNVTNLAISGSITCNITGAGFPVATLTLLSYSSKTGGGSFVLGTLPPGAVATLNDDGANVTLNITSPSIQNLTWSTGDGIWQTNGGLNWNANTLAYLEYSSGVNDIANFDDTGFGTVTINGQVNPSATIVNVSSSFYTFDGSGRIGGTNGIVKLGTGVLTINNSNSFTGPVTISGGSGSVGGTIFVGNSDALGASTGVVTVNGPANTLEIGTPFGPAVVVSNKSVAISGTGVGGARGALRGAAVASGTNEWAGPVTIGADLSRIGTEDGGNLTVSGTITDNGLNLGLLLRPGTSSTLLLSGTGNSYGYTRTFGDNGSSFIVLGHNDALSTNRLELGQGNIDLNGFNQAFAGINDNSGFGSILNNGSAPSTLTINTGTNSASSFFSGANLVDGTDVLSLIKSGRGTQTLNGGSLNYSGTTTIADGQLNLNSANPMNSAITVLAGGTLGGEGTTAKSLTLNANSTVSCDPSTDGSFTADTINATAGPIKISLTRTAPANADSLVLYAPNGITGSAANFQIVGARGGTFHLANNNTQLMFTPSAVNASLVWKGNSPINPSFWDTITTTNWSNGGTPDLFYAGDNVTFDDTANSYTVSIQGSSVQPSSMTVNSATDYNLSGVIGGGASVSKGGTGTLFLNNNNSYSGVTLITNGTVTIQTSGALGTVESGTLISGNGTLDLNTGAPLANTINLGAEVLTISGYGFNGNGAIVNNSVTAFQLNAVQQVVMAGNASIGGSFRWDMRGSGNSLDMAGVDLTKVGGNQISFVGTLINNAGNIVVSNGILGLQLGANLNGSSANRLTVNNGGTLEFYQASVAPTWTLVMNGGSTLWGESGFIGQNNWAGPVTLNGAVTFQADGVLNIDGEISGPGSLIKSGNNLATLTASNSYTGNTTVDAGSLALYQPSLAASSSVIIASNAVLNLNYAETNMIAALVLNGTNQPAGVYDATSAAPFITGTGALQVIPLTPPTLKFTSIGGNQLQFSWTGGGTLQSQTNTLNAGLGTNWVDYPGSSPVTITVRSSPGSVFFRVKQ